MESAAQQINWSEHWVEPARCRIHLRENYMGREVKPACRALEGREFDLVAMWKMGRDDPYPGEYALAPQHSCRELWDIGGIAWIASGDVVPISA